MRIFVAVPLPQPIKNSLTMLTQTNISGARWEHPNDFHLTLRFIGDVDSAAYQRYMAALATVHLSPFNLILRGVGRFPEQRSRTPKVLWVGVRITPELIQLHSDVSVILEANGLPKDKFSEYSPHVTLARFDEHPSLDQLDAFLHHFASFETELIPVGEIVLYKSEHAADGAKYKPIASFALKK